VIIPETLGFNPGIRDVRLFQISFIYDIINNFKKEPPESLYMDDQGLSTGHPKEALKVYNSTHEV
jgi:hypothetical protein